MRGVGLIGIATLALSGWGCGLLAPTCLARQQHGTSYERIERVEAGQTIVHRVDYDTRGSQNDIDISWNWRDTAHKPRLGLSVTRTGCETGPIPGADRLDPCAVLASGAYVDGGAWSRFSVTHGRGNPEVLGTPPAFLLWIVGDAEQGTLYTLTVSWFYGPDC